MDEPQRLPECVCSACPLEAIACVHDGWKAVAVTSGCFRLRFTCRAFDVSLETVHDGYGPWHVVDHGAALGGRDVAHGHAPRRLHAMLHAADAFHECGYFATISRETVATAMLLAYREAFAPPSRARRALGMAQAR